MDAPARWRKVEGNAAELDDRVGRRVESRGLDIDEEGALDRLLVVLRIAFRRREPPQDDEVGRASEQERRPLDLSGVLLGSLDRNSFRAHRGGNSSLGHGRCSGGRSDR